MVGGVQGQPGAAAAVGKRTQCPIDDAIHRQAEDAYSKLLKTAYVLAVDGLPLSSFRSLVRIQKINGIKLLQGTDSSDRAREFVHEIADAIRDRLADILSSSIAFSVLSDGSQARKTAKEKELVLVRTVNDHGTSQYYVAALQDMDQFGDANAENIHKAIDDVFENKVKLPKDHYTKGLVSATADGASVNTGIYNGLLVRMQKDERPWIVMIHCISHRVELAVKDSLMKENSFQQIKDLMITIYYLMKRSGKFKRHFEATAEALGVQIYRFPKVHGTRFVAHQRKGTRILLHNWIPLALAIENSISNSMHRPLNAKLQGILKKLRDNRFLHNSCLFRQILDILSCLSLKFEREDILPCEVVPTLLQTKARIQDLLEDDSISPLEKEGFSVLGDEISIDLPREGHMRRAAENRSFVPVRLERMSAHSTDVSSLKQNVLPALLGCLEARFHSFGDNSVYRHMMWVNPANWRSDVATELESLQALARHFSTTLDARGFDGSKLKLEWKDLKVAVQNYYLGVATKELWKQILLYRRKEFPNVCLLVCVVMAIGVSNSTVEGAFSVLSAMLSDRRLSLRHDTMEDLLLIKANHSVWSEMEQDELITAALKRVMQKKRKLKLDDDQQQQRDAGALLKAPKLAEKDDSDLGLDLPSDSDVSDGSEEDDASVIEED